MATSYAPAASVTSVSYAPHGALASETLGNNLVHAQTYNNRLQPTAIKLGTAAAPTSIVSLTYNYGTTTNNGNVQSVSYAGGGLSYTQTYGYDQLNRLTTSQEGASWSQTNSYDRYGNRTIVGSGMTFDPNNNRITNAGYTYDPLVGNLLTDGAHSYTYDAENKISKVDNVSAYVYDGEGQRVRKLVNENLRFIYGIGGQQIAEFSGSNGTLKKEYIYGASGLVATIEPTAVNANGTRYTTSDHLGSPRVVTASSAAVVSRHDYKPFGEELGSGIGGRTPAMGYGVADGLRQKFTSKERDNETGLDYFLARYYSSTQGRFTSPDSFAGSRWDPQSLNRYGYVQNNPLNFTDPTGHMREPWKINPLDHLFGPKVSESMLQTQSGQSQQQGQKPQRGGQQPQHTTDADGFDEDGVVRINTWDGEVVRINSTPAFPTTIFVWRPSLREFRSVGGHVSSGVEGLMYSWEQGGFRRPLPSIRQYLNENKWRTADAYVIDFPNPSKNADFRNGLKTGYDNVDNGYQYIPDT